KVSGISYTFAKSYFFIMESIKVLLSKNTTIVYSCDLEPPILETPISFIMALIPEAPPVDVDSFDGTQFTVDEYQTGSINEIIVEAIAANNVTMNMGILYLKINAKRYDASESCSFLFITDILILCYSDFNLLINLIK